MYNRDSSNKEKMWKKNLQGIHASGEGRNLLCKTQLGVICIPDESRNSIVLVYPRRFSCLVINGN